MRSFKKDDYIKLGRWLAPTLSWVPWMYWGKGGTIKKLGLPESGEYVLFDGYGFLNKDAVITIQNRARKEIESDDYSLFDVWFSETDRILGQWASFYKRPTSSIKDKIRLFADYMDWYAHVTQNWHLVFLFEEIIHEHIEKLSADDNLSMDAVSSHLHPIRPTLLMKEQVAVRAIQRKLKNGENVDDNIKKHLEEYEWVGTHHFWGEPLTEKKIKEELSKEPLADETKSEVMPGGFSQKLRQAILFAQKIIWLRTYSAEISDVSSFKLRPVMSDIAKERGLVYGDMIWLTTSEITLGLETAEAKQLIKDRKIKYGMYLENGEIVVITGAEVDEQLGDLLGEENNVSDITEIAGRVGNKGYVRGTVRIVLIPNDASSFREGEILVAPETTPDFVPVMKKAAAFVTDQGGITSHAAIVAREMKKPCIIGTKIATKVLKDGDLVEVDADKGVVRKIKA